MGRCDAAANFTLWEEDLVDGDSVAIAHVVLSSISAFCCLLVLGLSMRFEPLRRFPNNMLLWKTGCDFVTSSFLIGINSALLGNHGGFNDYRPADLGGKRRQSRH